MTRRGFYYSKKKENYFATRHQRRRRAMSGSSSGSDDDFAAELEREMTAVASVVPPAFRPTVVVTVPSTKRDGVDALLRGVGQKAEVRKFVSDVPTGTGTAPRRAVKRARVPLRPGSRVIGDSSGTADSVASASKPATAQTKCPPHPGFLHDICVKCGVRRAKQLTNVSTDDNTQTQSTSMRYIHAGLELSTESLNQAKREEKDRVMRSGKLMLVLDLDHTLLNSARFAELTQEQHDLLGRVIAARQCLDLGGSAGEVAQAAHDACVVRDACASSGAEETRGDAEMNTTDGVAKTDTTPETHGDAETKTDTTPETHRDAEMKSYTTPETHGDVEMNTDTPDVTPVETDYNTADTEPPTYPGCSPPLDNTHCLRHLALFTKLRPFAHEFLHAAAKLCQLYIYTMGDNLYAAEMASLLDPTGVLFAGRIISNQESTNSRVKDLDIVLGGSESVLIVDDTDRVWPHNLQNLVRIDRYHFFTQSAAGFRVPGASVMEKGWVDEGGNGDRFQLRDAFAVIASAHRQFFRGTEARGLAAEALAGFARGDTLTGKKGDTLGSGAADVDTEKDKGKDKLSQPLGDESLALIRNRDVRELLLGTPEQPPGPLSGVSIAFSRITTMGEPRPERHPLWLLASSAGACVSGEVQNTENTESERGDTKKTTHVVVRGEKTEKTKWALENDAHAVTSEWLFQCVVGWEKIDERSFSVLPKDDSKSEFADFEKDDSPEVSA